MTKTIKSQSDDDEIENVHVNHREIKGCSI